MAPTALIGCLAASRTNIPHLHHQRYSIAIASTIPSASTPRSPLAGLLAMPDLNSLPPSQVASRRHSSQQTSPPSASAQEPSSLHILPSNQDAVNQNSSVSPPDPALTSTQATMAQTAQQSQPPGWASHDAGVGPGPGPLRHPRPLTASEMHAELEKEQEAVVNRLTRELSLLRAAQNASVVSNTSSTSGGASIHEPHNDTSLLSGSGFTIPARRHDRTSSMTSNTAAQLGTSYESRSAMARAVNPASLSRQNSTTSRTSQTNSPAPQPSSLDPSSYFQHQRNPPPTSISTAGATAHSSTGQGEQLSPGLIPATSRYEETAYYRSELDAAKRENEMLKRRIRELERHVRERRASEASRTRSDSVSTTASTTASVTGAQSVTGAAIAGPRDTHGQRTDRDRGMTAQSTTSVAGSVGVGIPDDELKVGESAASSGRP